MSGSGTATTSPKPKEPVVLRKPNRYFFEAVPLGDSRTIGYDAAVEALENAIKNKLTQLLESNGARVAGRLLTYHPVIFAVGAIFYSPSLNSGETEFLAEMRRNQLYRAMKDNHLAGSYARLDESVQAGNYLTEDDLQKLAKENGRAPTRIRHRFETDYVTQKVVDQSYEIDEKTGLNRVRVRFAIQLSADLWGFEDPDTKSLLVWSRSGISGEFVGAGSPQLPHDGPKGGWSTPPTPIPENRKPWGLPNPEPISIPAVPPTPRPEPKKADIEYIPIHEQDFNDYIIVDPMGTAPSIYVYFKKPPVDLLEVDIYERFFGRSRSGTYEVDHIPSKAAVIEHFKTKYPDMELDEIEKMTNKVAAVSIPKEVHQKCSETYGGRNHTKTSMPNGEKKSKIQIDASDLEKAVDANWAKNAECLKRDHGISEERLEEVRKELHRINREHGVY